MLSIILPILICFLIVATVHMCVAHERYLMTKAVVLVAGFCFILGVLITPVEGSEPMLVQFGLLLLSGICSAVMGLFFAGFAFLFFGEE